MADPASIEFEVGCGGGIKNVGEGKRLGGWGGIDKRVGGGIKKVTFWFLFGIEIIYEIRD